MDIYIKPPKKASMIGRDKVLIEDLTEVIATKDVADKVKKLAILNIGSEAENKSDKRFYLVSVTDIVKAIKKAYPEISVQNLGEMDTIIEYKAEKSTEKEYVKWLKVGFVALTLFIGSIAAIMSFHTDSEMSTILQNFHFMLFQVQTDSPLLIEIPYAIGLAAGIIVFFNHFFGKRLTTDLTPIEVELPIYENDVNDAIIDKLSTQKQETEEVQNDGR